LQPDEPFTLPSRLKAIVRLLPGRTRPMPPTSGSDREVTCQRVPASGFCGAASVTFKDCCWVTRWQAGLVHFQLLFAMDLDRCFLGALPVRLGFVGLDVGFALLAFQAVDLVPQLLNLCLCVPQVGAHSFDQIQQPVNQLPGIFILDVAQVYRVQHIQHSGVILHAYCENGKLETFRAFCIGQRHLAQMLTTVLHRKCSLKANNPSKSLRAWRLCGERKLYSILLTITIFARN
jgi:hypothetical protein